MKRPPLIPLIVVLFFVALMSFMGFWQLTRAKEKELLLELLDAKHVTQITKAEQLKVLPRYANIELKGHFLNQPQLILDNQINEGVRGYHIFTPFQLENSDFTIMVNRGWLSQEDYKQKQIDTVNYTVSIKAKLNTAPQVGFQLGEIELKDQQAQIITYYDEAKISEFLHQKLCSKLNCIVSSNILWLDKDSVNGFGRDWNPIIMMPEKHIGYAVQWFLMVLVLIVIFIYWLKKTNK